MSKSAIKERPILCTPISWPMTGEHEFWWMEYRPNPRRPLRTSLVQLLAEGQRVRKIETGAQYSEASAGRLQALFLPCPIPPEFPKREKAKPKARKP
jgi:hypothetical protein